MFYFEFPEKKSEHDFIHKWLEAEGGVQFSNPLRGEGFAVCTSFGLLIKLHQMVYIPRSWYIGPIRAFKLVGAGFDHGTDDVGPFVLQC